MGFRAWGVTALGRVFQKVCFCYKGCGESLSCRAVQPRVLKARWYKSTFGDLQDNPAFVALQQGFLV